jgi:hypothetical protein
MNKLVLLLSIFLTLTYAQAQDNGGLSGKWKLHQSIAGNESDSEYSFTQKANDLTGSCTGGEKAVDITGKVDGDKVSWSYKADYNGTPLTVTYTGTLDTGKIKGEVNVDPFNATGDFTAILEK